ncbi:MAG: alpha/beta fold hydrolase [Candidatus Marinimicrobia bacterium]|nr:alpha/beta fold hydrolase [Candidatus Neomarinimicrobiota bacterium]
MISLFFWAILSANYLSTDKSETDLKKKTTLREGQIKVNNLNLHYREWGCSGLPPLLILHGLTGHVWEFDSLAMGLADHFHVIVVNQRGHGASDWAEDYSAEIMADDISGMINALELTNPYIIGHSMGGVNSWVFASGHADKIAGLVIVDVNPKTITFPPMVEGFITALNSYADARYANSQEAVADYLNGYSGNHRAALTSFVLNNLIEKPDGSWIWRFDASGLMDWVKNASGSEKEYWSALRNIKCPTLIIRAENSPFTTESDMNRMQSILPGAQLVEISDSGHDLHIDQLDVLAEVLKKFFKLH